MGCSKSHSKRKVYSNKIHLRKQENAQINKLTLHLWQLEREDKQDLKLAKGKNNSPSQVILGAMKRLPVKKTNTPAVGTRHTPLFPKGSKLWIIDRIF